MATSVAHKLETSHDLRLQDADSNFAVTLTITLKRRHTFCITITHSTEGAYALLCWRSRSLCLFWVRSPSWLLVPQVSHCSEKDNACVELCGWGEAPSPLIRGPSRGGRGRISDRRRINLNLITWLLWSKVLHCVWVLSVVCIATEHCYFCWAGIITKRW